MEKREQLMEEYEDALFALLMDEVAQAEGEKALKLNEQLKADPAAAVPLRVQKRVGKTIRTEFAKKNAAVVKRGSAKVFRHILVAVLMLLLLFTTALATSRSFRTYTLNLVITAFDKFSELTVGDTSATQSATEDAELNEDSEGICNYNIALDWLPTGYELADGWSDNSSAFAEYTNEQGDVITISAKIIDSNLTYRFDTEDSQQKAVKIQGCDANLYIKKYDDGLVMSSVLWIDKSRQSVMYVSATELTETELLQFAESVEWVD